MVRLVHHEKANATGAREVVDVDGKVLRRGEDDRHVAGSQRLVDASALVRRRFARKHRNAHASRRELVGKMVHLVGDKRAQWVHKDAGTVPHKSRARGVDVKHERLAAPRCHDAEGRVAVLQAPERLVLRGKERVLADEGAHQACGKSIVVLGQGRRCR